MQKPVVCIILTVLLFIEAFPLDIATAAERERPFRIGALTNSWGPTPHILGLRDGLTELGYRENEDFVLGVRFTQGNTEALPEAARQLVRYGVDLIFAAGEPKIGQAAQMTTTQIPIVFVSSADPLRSGLAQSFAQPGGNITGVTSLSLALSPKRLQVFSELVPEMKRILFLYNANNHESTALAKIYREAADRLGIVLVERIVRTEKEAQAALSQTIRKGTVDGVLAPNSLSLNIPGLILKVAAQQKFPTMFDGAFYVEQGGLASYGPDFYKSGRQAARLVDKILKGANPGEIPIEVNSKIEFAINLKTATTLGLTIPPEVLYQANRLIR